MNNTAILCFVMGYQGGTVHQVAKDLCVTTDAILYATDEEMGTLCRTAQRHFYKRQGVNGLLLKHLQRCVGALNANYEDEALRPEWLKCAEGVGRIMAEAYEPEPAKCFPEKNATGAL